MAISLAAALAGTGAVAGAPAWGQDTTGTISGRFLDRSGIGLSDFSVQLQPVGSGSWHWTQTGWDGSFSADVKPGSYRIAFFGSYPDFSGLTQYVPGTDVPAEASLFEVKAGQTITFTDTMYATGTITGRFADAAGNPMAGISVSATRDGVEPPHFTMTDAEGRYTLIMLRVHSAWRIQFQGYSEGFEQYAYGASRLADAALFDVRENQSTVVDDRRLPTGTLKIVAKDAITGEAVPRFTVRSDSGGYGDGMDGEASLVSIASGVQDLEIQAYGFETIPGHEVTVQAGQETIVTVAMQPKTRIDATVIDSATGQPVQGVCLMVFKPAQFTLPDWCDGHSSAGGKAIVEVSEPGWYQVFAYPVEAPGYGAQWVTNFGGSGKQLHAKLVKVEAGKAAHAPVVKMDRAGTITGTVTRADGSVATNGSVSPGDWSTFVGPGVGVVDLDERGRYTVNFLGPYRWPLRFTVWGGSAWQYSGGVANRHFAETVAVTPEQATTYDIQLSPGMRLIGDINGISGYCYLLAYNGVTQENVGITYVEDCSQDVVLRLVGPQFVKLRVMGEGIDRWLDGPMFIPSSGEKTVTINFE